MRLIVHLRGFGGLLVFLFLVGDVAQSEKSPENFPRKVSQNAYIAYTTYIGWGLEVDYRLDTVPLHSAGSAMLVDVPINVRLKQYNNICPHQALNMKPPNTVEK